MLMRAFVARGVRVATAGMYGARDRVRGAAWLGRNKKEETRDIMAVRVKGGWHAKGNAHREATARPDIMLTKALASGPTTVRIQSNSLLSRVSLSFSRSFPLPNS
jgi:hypothetical protein